MYKSQTIFFLNLAKFYFLPFIDKNDNLTAIIELIFIIKLQFIIFFMSGNFLVLFGDEDV